MTPERWQQIRQAYERANALDAAQRSPYLAEIALRDAELCREVESLLSQMDRVESSFLNQPAADLLAPDLNEAPGFRAGRDMGPYLLIEEIGHGGMGEVYRARRADGQYQKEVAIKLVRGGYDTGLILERFRYERQILANLDHANIARLLDGGTTDDGIPYLVMELIAGTPIDEYCEKRKLPVSERLALFRQVCFAVQYAHQHLIVHRDLKPSNILVTDDGVPKLLDFGIAKILGPSGGGEATLPHAMTPEYASPEQIRGEPITTATDVYCLGVVLYRLLAGCSPYPADTRSQHELARAICETDPDRPSTAVGKQEAKGGREVSSSKLRRQLRGDLDTIVLKALRKEPQRRYASVEQFSEDIRRHLAGLPVTAAPDSLSYRTSKFVARNKAAVATAALVLLTLSGGILATLRQARIARQQAEIARLQRSRAEKRLEDVRQFSDSLIFDIHDAIQNLPGATPARKLLLDRAVQYLDQASRDASGNFDLQRELAWGYQRLAVVQGSPTESNLGDTAAAEASNRKAAALFEAVAAGNPHDVIDQLNVAMIHRILAFSTLLRPSGKLDLEKAMAITDRLMVTSSDDPRVRSERSIEYQNRALMEDAFGYRARALEDFRKDLALKQSILQTTPGYRRVREGIAVTMVLAADEMVLLGDRQEARQQIQNAVEMFREVLKQGADINVMRELAVSRTKLGEIELMEGNTFAASAIFRDVRSGLLPMAHNDPQNQMLQLDMAGLDYEQARVLASAGNHAAAMPALRRAIKTFQDLRTTERAIDDVGPGLGAFYIWLGEAQAGAGDLRAALDSYRKAAGVLGSPPDDAADDDSRCQLATSYLKAGKALLRRGDREAAGTAYRQALDIAAPLAAPEKQDIPALYILAEAYAGVADVFREQARAAESARERSRLAGEARGAYQKSLALWKNIPHPAGLSPEGFQVDGPATTATRLAEFAGHGAIR